MKVKNLSVSIISQDNSLRESLKNRLETDYEKSDITISSFKDVETCLNAMTNDSKEDVVLLDYNEELSDTLYRETNNLLKDYTLINVVTDNPSQYKSKFIESDIKEYTVKSNKPFKEVSDLLEKVTKRNEVKKSYAKPNYWIAGVTLILAISVLIYFLA